MISRAKILRRVSRGIGLLELMLSLAIIAVLLVMATRYYTIAARSQKVNEAISEISAVVGGVANWKGAKPDYTGLDWKALYDIGVLPDAYIKDSTPTVVDPWGNTATLAVGSPATSATLKFTGIPGSACLSLADKFSTVGTCTATDPTATGDFTYTIKGS